MKHVILQELLSLDGLAARPNESTDFVPAAPIFPKSMNHEGHEEHEGKTRQVEKELRQR